MSLAVKTFRSASKPMSNIRLGIIVATLVLIASSILTFVTFTMSINESDLAKHNRSVESKLEKIFALVKDCETSLRGYLLTNEAVFLDQFKTSKSNLPQSFLELEELIETNSSQLSSLIKLEDLITIRIRDLDSLNNIFQTGRLNADNTLVYMDQGRIIMEQIKTSISNMRNTENAFYESKYNNSNTFTQTARTVITIFSISSLLIIIFTFYILFKNQNDIADREMKYRRIFELSPDIIYQLDKNLVISEISPAITEQLGYKGETLINSNLGELFQEEKNTKFIEKTIKRGLSISNMEITLKHLDGRSISFLLNLYADNSTKSFQGSLINITERIRREREKNALEKFAGIGKIARIIAHEVRNPLTNINLSVDSLKNNADQTEINDFLEIIENNSKRINKLITELLYTTKVNINTSIPLSVNAVLDNTLELAKDRIKLKGITLLKKYDPDICSIEGDEQQLQMAFLNIIINAIEAMNGKENILEVEIKKVLDKCLISISDTGHGIKKDDIDNIFEPFFSTKKNGTGLGLATTQIIILLHGGTIEVTSTPEKGTKFIVSLNYL